MTPATGSGPTRARLAALGRRAVPVAWLVLVWILLWGTFSWANLLSGLVVAVAILVLFPLPRVAGRGRLRPVAALRFLARFVADVISSSVLVAWQSVRPGPPIRSSVVAVRLSGESEFLMALLVETLTLVPGSVVLEARAEEQTIYAHVLGADDEAAVDAFRVRVHRRERELAAAAGAGPGRDRTEVSS